MTDDEIKDMAYERVVCALTPEDVDSGNALEAVAAFGRTVRDRITISDIHEINPANWKRLEDYDRAIAERDEARAECKALHTEAHAAHDVIAQRDRMIDAMTNRAQELALEKMAADRRIAALEAMTCDECGKVIEEENAYAQDGRVFHSACWHDRRSGAACPKCMRELSVDEMRQLHERMPHRRWAS